jgi:hypothetical protein
MTRLISAWHALTPEQRLAGGASGALFVTMFLPWYQQNAVVNAPRTAPLQSRNLNAFQVFSFVEAAVLLVALAVLYLLFARGERRSFQLPGGDGAVVFAAGIWSALLLVLRLFDKPGISAHGVAANVGIQWGIFFALAASGMLALAGSRMRAARLLEPPRLRHPRPPSLQPQDPQAAQYRQAPRDRPPPPYPQPPDTTPLVHAARRPPPPPTASPTRAPRRPLAGEETEQLSFEDQPPGAD